MTNWENLTDPGRTLSAGLAEDQVHKIVRYGFTIYTYCGKQIPMDDVLMVLQRPEDITCPECRKLAGPPLKERKPLAPVPGYCYECAAAHEPGEPHDLTSIYYQMRFHRSHGRWPTWEDAMGHCDEEMKQLWREQLKFFGEKTE